MRYTTRRGKVPRPTHGAGSFWLSFSDLMSALLLIQTQPLIQKGARHFQRKER